MEARIGGFWYTNFQRLINSKCPLYPSILTVRKLASDWIKLETSFDPKVLLEITLLQYSEKYHPFCSQTQAEWQSNFKKKNVCKESYVSQRTFKLLSVEMLSNKRKESDNLPCSSIHNFFMWILFYSETMLTSSQPLQEHLFHISVFPFIWSSLKISFDSWTEAELVRGTGTGIWQAVMDQDPRERQRVRRKRRVEGWRSWEADGDSALALSPWGDKQPIWTTERKWWK